MTDFDISRYISALEREVRSFGFQVSVTVREKNTKSPVQSAFLKADTLNHLLVVETAPEIARQIPRGQVMRSELRSILTLLWGLIRKTNFSFSR